MFLLAPFSPSLAQAQVLAMATSALSNIRGKRWPNHGRCQWVRLEKQTTRTSPARRLHTFEINLGIQISIHCYHCYDQLYQLSLHEASSLNSSPNMANLANIPPPGWLTSPFLSTIRKNSLLCVACKIISQKFQSELTLLDTH